MNKLSVEQEKEIIELKKIKTPLKIIMEKFNICNCKTIYDVIKRNGREHIVGNKKYKVNHNYFKIIDNEDKAYWLGFLYADGYVRIHKNKSGHLKLKLKISDKEHIEKFNKCLESNYLINEGKEKFKKNNKEYVSYFSCLNIYNTELVSDLMNHGCLNNKTNKIRLPHLSDDLMNHFIRGYFDGDGCVYRNKKSKNTYTVSIVSNFYFIEELKTFLLNKIKLNNNDITIINNKTYSIMNIQKYEASLKFYKYIYKNSNFHLNRKKEIFDNILIKVDNGRRGKTNIKKYKITDPKGNIHYTKKGLADFCRNHSELNYSNMSAVARKIHKSHKNWNCEFVIDL